MNKYIPLVVVGLIALILFVVDLESEQKHTKPNGDVVEIKPAEDCELIGYTDKHTNHHYEAYDAHNHAVYDCRDFIRLGE